MTSPPASFSAEWRKIVLRILAYIATAIVIGTAMLALFRIQPAVAAVDPPARADRGATQRQQPAFALKPPELFGPAPRHRIRR